MAEIHSGGVGLVYLADIAPAALAKFSAPFWFPHVSYSVRACLAACLMVAALLTVSCGDTLWLQLLGVGFCSLQSGIGEASSLALTSLYHGPSTITAWSSGTGFAGVMVGRRSFHTRTLHETYYYCYLYVYGCVCQWVQIISMTMSRSSRLLFY